MGEDDDQENVIGAVQAQVAALEVDDLLSEHEWSLLENGNSAFAVANNKPVPKTRDEASIHFLVLEVADAKYQNSEQKILRLLNEQSGAERMLIMRDEWKEAERWEMGSVETEYQKDSPERRIHI
ncbi:unnamed protein product [Sphagnum jensenii]|uniref:Uncharacterized protein n=1 Tax=Sphagnum jensenii TaxID=128206 RepID=A0ABP0XBR2_9BRYO